MAQVKKLQKGGTTPTEPKKRIYNGVELTDDDINSIVSSVGQWGTQNSQYSEDLKGWSDLGNTVKQQMLAGNLPQFDTTGTGMSIGDLNVSAGKTNQNIFGNWSGTKLHSQYASKLKEALDKATTGVKQENNQTSIPKNYLNPINVLAKKHFGNNFESFENNWNTYDLPTRKAKLKEALIDSINEYGDSELKNRLSELNNPNLDDKTLIEIGNKTGYDYNELLNGTSQQNKQTDKYSNLKQYGDIVEDDYLKSKNLIGVRNKEGFTRLFNQDETEYTGTDNIETNYGKYYTYGMFKDPNKGWYWGTRQSFSGTPVYNIAEQNYALIRNKISQQLKDKFNNIDFNNERANWVTPSWDKYKDKNKLEFLDVSGNFSGLTQTDGNANRLIVPKKTAIYDDLGAIDIQNSPSYLFIDGKATPVTIKLGENSESIAVDQNGVEHSLGAYGDTQMNQMTPWTTYKQNIDLGIETPKLTQPQLQIAVNSIQGFNNNPITNQNFNYFLNQIANKRFKNNLTAEEANHLANTLVYYYNTIGKNINNNKYNINKIQNIIKELTSNVEIKSNFSNNFNTLKNNTTEEQKKIALSRAGILKNGGIIKAQAGASLSALKGKQSNVKKQTKLQVFQKDSHSGRLRDIDNWSSSDTLDAVGTGLDTLSLAGGAVGVGAGLASTLVQAVSDSNRSGFLSGDMLKNLGINLGFTALAFIPGASAVKVGKIAKNANKLAHASKFLKETEKAVKVLSKTEELADDAKKAMKAVETAKKLVSNAEKGKDITKFINKVTLNPITKTAATAARTGFAGLGITNGINSAGDIISDVNNGGVGSIQLNDLRGLVGGVAGTRAALGMTKNALIRKGTEPIKPFEKIKTETKEDASKFSKTKTKISDFKENVSKKTENYVKNKLTDNWENRKLKSEEGAGWLTKLGINQAKKVGFTEDGLGRNVNQKLIDVLNNESKLTSKPRLALPEYKPNIVNKPISGKYPVADEPYNPVKAFQASVNNLLKSNKLISNTIPKKVSKATKKVNSSKINKNRLNSLNKKGLIEEDGQLKMFKQGGKLIPKHYYGDEIISGEVISGQPNNLKEVVVTANKNNTKLPIKGLTVDPIKVTPISQVLNTQQTNRLGINTNYTLDPLKKRTLNIDTSTLRELPKLIGALSTNEKNRRLMSSVSPALLQTPTEIYKPVVTNLANENMVKQQTTDYLRRMSKPVTSDASLQKASILEALSKTTPLDIQAKAENTNMYNQTLNNAKDNSEKYALQRNEIANQNRQIIVADEAAKARYSAGKLIADNASFNNFFDKANQNFERNQAYKTSLENQTKLQGLQKEFSDKLKPYEEGYNLLSDYKKSDIYKTIFDPMKSRNEKLDWNTSIIKDGKTASQLFEEEKENKYKTWQSKRDELTPYYQNQFNQINYRNPNLTTLNIGSYKSGGDLAKIEVQKLKNKLKEKELDAKFLDKSLDRQQKEIASILNGLSKETFFLLKTVLGK